MNTTLRNIGLALALCGASSLAMAAPFQYDHDDHDRHAQHDRRDQHDRHESRDRGGHGDHGDRHDRGPDRPAPQHRSVRVEHHGSDYYRTGWRHPRHWQRWERGHRYAGPTYVVRDYGYYHLRQPPRGYHWVRGDTGSYLLVAIATGVILDIALH